MLSRTENLLLIIIAAMGLYFIESHISIQLTAGGWLLIATPLLDSVAHFTYKKKDRRKTSE
jgi:hypothetical protein